MRQLVGNLSYEARHTQRIENLLAMAINLDD